MALLLTSNAFPQQDIECKSIKYANQLAMVPKIDTAAYTISAMLGTDPGTQLTPPVIDVTTPGDGSRLSISGAAVTASVPAVAATASPSDGVVTTADGGKTFTVATPFYGEVTVEWSHTPDNSLNTGFLGYAIVNRNSANNSSLQRIVAMQSWKADGSSVDYTLKTTRASFRSKYDVGDVIALDVASIGAAVACNTRSWSIAIEIINLL